MRGTLAEWRVVFAEELRRIVRRRTFLLLVASVPLLLAVVLGAVMVVRQVTDGTDAAPEDIPAPIGVVDLSPDLEPAGRWAMRVQIFTALDDGMRALVDDGRVGQLFVVTEDYLRTGRVEWLPGVAGYTGESRPDAASRAIVTSMLRAGLAAGNLTPEALSRAAGPAIFERARIGDGSELIEERDEAVVGRFIIAFAAALVLLFSIMIGASSLVTAVAEEKENRMIETLLTSVRPFALLAGKLIAVGVANLAIVAVWSASIIVAVPLIIEAVPDARDVPVDPGVLPWVFAFFLAGYLVSGVVMAGIGAVATGVREASQLAAVVIVPLVAPLYALPVFLVDPDGGLARALSFVPFTAPTAMMMRLAVGSPAPLEMAASLLVMLLVALGLLWVAARAFSAGLLDTRGGVRRFLLLVRRPA